MTSTVGSPRPLRLWLPDAGITDGTVLLRMPVVLPAARRRGHATRIARLLAEHAFSLGVVRVAAYVNVGNRAP
jgi:RimJ/RimL family protein N-acetyltransferase